jgi:DNA-binding beta-propeller fold protein YncE
MIPILATLPMLSQLPQTLPTSQRALRDSFAPAVPGKLLVSGYDSNAVHRYRASDGAPRGSSAVMGAQSIVLGTDGLLYICAEKSQRVVRHDPQTLARVDIFVQDDPATPEDENGPLSGPTSATFGPDGALYVASFNTDQILRFDGQTGAYLGVFVSAGLGGLNGPDSGTKFGADGLLYVPSFWSDRVLRYDATGAFHDEFVSFREGNLRQPRDLVQHEGDWYVASSFNDRILRFDAQGNYVGIFASVPRPYSLAFNHHDENLYVVSLARNAVSKFAGDSGSYLGDIVPTDSGGIDGAVYLFFLD